MEIVIKTNSTKEGMVVAKDPTMFLNITDQDLFIHDRKEIRVCILTIGFEKFEAKNIDSIETWGLGTVSLYDQMAGAIINLLIKKNPNIVVTLH